jgi:DNA-binding transcriptional ArsR family regulator
MSGRHARPSAGSGFLIFTKGAGAESLSGKRSLAYCRRVGDVFRALADPTRRVILDELRERDGQTLFELRARLATRHGLGSTRQAVSQHLGVLEDAGLVTTRREGRYKFHHFDPAPLTVIVERWLTDPGKDQTCGST